MVSMKMNLVQWFKDFLARRRLKKLAKQDPFIYEREDE